MLLERVPDRQQPRELAIVAHDRDEPPVGIVENLGYRQMLSVFKIKAFWDLLLRQRHWGRMERTGFERGEDTPDDAAPERVS